MTPTEILDVIIIIYYVPALALAIYVGLKHGFDRSAGWFNLIMLGVFRLVGSALGIAAVSSPSTGVIITAAIFSSMGTVSLLGALLGLASRSNQSLGDRAFPPRITRLLHLATLAAIVLSIVGGNYAYGGNPDKQSEGHTLSKVAIILLIVIFVAAVGICLLTLAQHSLIPQSERRLLHVALVSLPFVLVRLILAICSVFDWTSSTFSVVSTTNKAVIVRAIMGVLMEFIVVALFLWAGCTVDRSAQRERERAEKHAANGSYQSEHGPIHDSRIAMQKLGSGNV